MKIGKYKIWENGKFTKPQIQTIRQAAKMGIKQKCLADKYKCSKSTISEIVNFKRYKHIK